MMCRSRPTIIHTVLLCLVFSTIHPSQSLSAPSSGATGSQSANNANNDIQNNRHVCLMDSYEEAQGPHVSALLDEVWEQTGFPTKRVAYITLEDENDESDNKESILKAKIRQLHKELDLEVCEIITLSSTTGTDKSTRQKCDPDQIREKIESLNPSILWIAPHENAYLLRHSMRIHNVDQIVQELCGPVSGNACLLVGEGAGALCAGANMAVAALRGDDTKACPELQFRGLAVLGPRRSVSFAKPLLRAEAETYLQEAQAKLDRVPLYDPNRDITTFLNPKQVYVYSQLQGGETTSLVMNPYQKGAIEQLETSSHKPVPPLSTSSSTGSTVARECTGEPSEDPSRTIHLYTSDDW